MASSTSGVTSQQQLDLARARFASFATQQPTTNFQNGAATNPGAATTGSQATGTATPAGTTAAQAPAQKPLVIPKMKLPKDAHMDDTLSALSGAMVDPTTSQEAVTVLYDFQKTLFDMQKQSTSLWLNGSQ